MKSNKSTGLDNISNEMLKSGQSFLIPCLHKLFNNGGEHPAIFIIAVFINYGLQNKQVVRYLSFFVNPIWLSFLQILMVKLLKLRLIQPLKR
jgi:hypothetical protein